MLFRSPDAIYEKPETIAFVPELHMFSTLCEIFGVIPVISDRIGARYFLLLLVETSTASISFCLRFFVVSNNSFVADTRRSSIGVLSCENLVVQYPAIATLIMHH